MLKYEERDYTEEYVCIVTQLLTKSWADTIINPTIVWVVFDDAAVMFVLF